MSDKPPRRKVDKAKPTPPIIRKKQSSIPRPPELQAVSIHGLYVDSVNVIPKTAASLHLMPGRLDSAEEDVRRKVLVPFVELRLGGGKLKDIENDGDIAEEDVPTLFTANVPLENLAFMLLDLTSDLKRICQEVCSLGNGELTVDSARMAAVRYFVAHLERQARSCRVRLDDHYGEPEETTDE